MVNFNGNSHDNLQSSTYKNTILIPHTLSILFQPTSDIHLIHFDTCPEIPIFRQWTTRQLRRPSNNTPNSWSCMVGTHSVPKRWPAQRSNSVSFRLALHRKPSISCARYPDWDRARPKKYACCWKPDPSPNGKPCLPIRLTALWKCLASKA